jgi:hypothetical protein
MINLFQSLTKSVLLYGNLFDVPDTSGNQSRIIVIRQPAFFYYWYYWRAPPFRQDNAQTLKFICLHPKKSNRFVYHQASDKMFLQRWTETMTVIFEKGCKRHKEFFG